ncbi:hypothetical protein CDAR_587921, partial [Caerostris darwini]
MKKMAVANIGRSIFKCEVEPEDHSQQPFCHASEEGRSRVWGCQWIQHGNTDRRVLDLRPRPQRSDFARPARKGT